MKLIFIGAAHEVTGSCTLLEACGKHILIDCGMEQGGDTYENCELSVHPSEIDAILLTHAHIDHSGGLAEMMKTKTVPVYGTAPTIALVPPMINDMYNLIMNWHSWNQFFNDEMLLRYRAGKKGPNPQQELWIFIRDNEADYSKAGRMWDFFYNSLNLLSRHYNRKFISPVAFDKLVNNAIKFVKSEADLPQTKDRQQKRFTSLVELLYGNREWGQGERVNANLKDEKTRAWNEYRAMYGKAEDRHANATFNDCVQKLEGIAAKFATDSGMVSRALSSKAYIYHHKIGKYEEAIKAYQELSRPPETLYNIADCQKRLKKSQEALRTYAEIAGSFPREAPNAFWHMGEYYRQLGDQKRAVATYRAILRRHPKSPQASWSHQVLERLGIDETGLGADEDF